MAFTRERELVADKVIEILYPLHEIDSYNGEEMRQYTCTLDDISSVIINFSRVTYLNSSGLRELIQILKGLKENGITLFLTAVNEDIKKIFDNTNLNRLFNIYESNSEAFKH